MLVGNARHHDTRDALGRGQHSMVERPVRQPVRALEIMMSCGHFCGRISFLMERHSRLREGGKIPR